MKLIFENWRRYLKEQEETSVVTFDFDDTLSLSHWGEEEDEWVHDGPHKSFVDKIQQYKNNGNTVYVVTSRTENYEPQALENPNQRAVQEFLDEHGISVDGVYFTNGQSKIETLLQLGSTIHHDDDPGDILDARSNNIEAVVSDPYGDYKDLEASELQQREEEPEEELEEVGMIPGIGLNMRPNGIKDAEDRITNEPQLQQIIKEEYNKLLNEQKWTKGKVGNFPNRRARLNQLRYLRRLRAQRIAKEKQAAAQPKPLTPAAAAGVQAVGGTYVPRAEEPTSKPKVNPMLSELGIDSRGVENPTVKIDEFDEFGFAQPDIDAWIKINGIPETGSELLELEAFLKFGDSTKIFKIVPQMEKSVYFLDHGPNPMGFGAPVKRWEDLGVNDMWAEETGRHTAGAQPFFETDKAFDTRKKRELSQYYSSRDRMLGMAILSFIENKYFVNLEKPFAEYGQILDNIRAFNEKTVDLVRAPNDPARALGDLDRRGMPETEFNLRHRIIKERGGSYKLQTDKQYNEELRDLHKRLKIRKERGDPGYPWAPMVTSRMLNRVNSIKPRNIIFRHRTGALASELGTGAFDIHSRTSMEDMTDTAKSVWSNKEKAWLREFLPATLSALGRIDGLKPGAAYDLVQQLRRSPENLEHIGPVWYELKNMLKRTKQLEKERLALPRSEWPPELQQHQQGVDDYVARIKAGKAPTKAEERALGTLERDPGLHPTVLGGDPSSNVTRTLETLLGRYVNSSWLASRAAEPAFEPGGLILTEPKSELEKLSVSVPRSEWSPELQQHQQGVDDYVAWIKDWIKAGEAPTNVQIRKFTAPKSIGGKAAGDVATPTRDLTTPKEKLYTPEETPYTPEDYEFD